MKITFFLGRIHHALKLLPVASALQERGAEIEILIADNSINIDPTTEYLHQFGVHQFHHANDYADEFEALPVNIPNFSECISMVPPFWTISSVAEVMRNVAGFGKYLDTHKPNAVFALHENNFFVKTLFYCASARNIRTYSLQEGMILEREESDLGKYSTGTDYTDILFSWSEYDRQFYSDPEKIVPVGPSHLDDWINQVALFPDFRSQFKQKLGFAQHGKVIVFAPPRLDLYRGDAIHAFNALADWTQDRGIGLIIKLHPFQGGVDGIKNHLSRYVHVRVDNSSDSIPFVIGADVLVTQTSTIALEALVLGTPVVELDLDYIGLEQALWKHGAATLIEGGDLDRLFDTKSTTGFVDGRFPLADGLSTKRIVDYVLANRRIK